MRCAARCRGCSCSRRCRRSRRRRSRSQAPALEIGAGRLRLVFELDGPGALLLGVAALLWSAAGAYAATYMHDTPNPGRFVACWLMACAGCLGVFVAGDLVSLYAMLAMLTLGASGLVIHDETAQAWRSGSIYLVLALLAESVLLVGLVMLAGEIPGDSLRLRDAAAALADSPDRDLIMALLVAGFGTKAGLVPMHVWMPLAHAAAPVPASSVLSGAVVKVGIIGLIRFLPLSEAMPDWGFVLTAVGFVTAFYAVAIGLTQRHPEGGAGVFEREPDGRRRAVLGMGLAAGDATAGMAAAFYASHHVLVKGALFLAVGVIAASGAGRRTVVLVPAVLLCLGLGGLPFTGGAIAKYAVKDQLDVGVVGWLAAASAVGTTLLMLHFCSRLASYGKRGPAGDGYTGPALAVARDGGRGAGAAVAAASHDRARSHGRRNRAEGSVGLAVARRARRGPRVRRCAAGRSACRRSRRATSPRRSTTPRAPRWPAVRSMTASTASSAPGLRRRWRCSSPRSRSAPP